MIRRGRGARGARGRERAIGLFVVQLLINYAWSPAFFAYHKVDLALGMIAAMIVLTLATALLFARIRRAAALLLLPYLAWLCFAGYLTLGIATLNPGAETHVEGAVEDRVEWAEGKAVRLGRVARSDDQDQWLAVMNGDDSRGEADLDRLTVCGLTYLRERDGSIDSVRAGYTGL